MNKKDCENIGWILSNVGPPEHVRERFFTLDPRIKEEYEAFEYGAGRDKAVVERFEALMIERLGDRWCLMKAAKGIQKEVYEQARREVYGEDYDQSLFKQ